MKCIHETVVRDVIDLATTFKDSDEVKRFRNYASGASSAKSIVSKAEALTMVFPVGCSKNASYESAALITKAIERKAVGILQMLFAASNITDAKNGVDYLSNFHSNLSIGQMSVDDFMDAMDNFVDENALLVKESSEYEAYEKIKNDMKAMNFYFENNVVDESINDFNIVKVGETTVYTNSYEDVNEDKRDDLEKSLSGLNTAKYKYNYDKDGNYIGATPIDSMSDLERQDIIQRALNSFDQGARADAQAKEQERKNKADEDWKRGIENQRRREAAAGYRQKERQMASDDLQNIIKNSQADRKNDMEYQKLMADINKNRLVDQDVKKANELVPTLMYVNFIVAGNDDQYPIQSSVVIGVKAKLYAVDGQDIMNRLKIKHNDKNLLLNLIKVSTREISFFRDFLFAIDKAKVDALSQSRRGSSSKLWKVLERRALRAKLKRAFALKNDATPITTLVITQDEVEFLKKTEYFDVENPRVIRPIMDAYNFMGFVIVDESLEIAKFIFDTGEDIYETITYNNLEREQKDNTKKIINLMSKMNR